MYIVHTVPTSYWCHDRANRRRPRIGAGFVSSHGLAGSLAPWLLAPANQHVAVVLCVAPRTYEQICQFYERLIIDHRLMNILIRVGVCIETLFWSLLVCNACLCENIRCSTRVLPASHACTLSDLANCNQRLYITPHVSKSLVRKQCVSSSPWPFRIFDRIVYQATMRSEWWRRGVGFEYCVSSGCFCMTLVKLLVPLIYLTNNY